MADAPLLFGFLDDLVEIHFPRLWLVVEGVNDPLFPGALSWYSWNAAAGVPTPHTPTGTTGATGPVGAHSPFLVNSKLNNPDTAAYLNVSLPKGPTGPAPDPNPGLNFTGSVPAKNVAWTYPRPSLLETGNTGVQGVAFFNLGLLKPGVSDQKPFTMKMVEGFTGADVSEQFMVRASLWRNVTDMNSRVKNGAITNFGPNRSIVNGKPTMTPGAIASTTLTGRFDGTNPNVFLTATNKTVILTNPRVVIPVPQYTTDVALNLVISGAGGGVTLGLYTFFVASQAAATPPISNVETVGTHGNRVDNFTALLALPNVTTGSYLLGMRMQVSFPGSPASMTVDLKSTLTLTRRLIAGGGTPVVTTYTLDPSVFPNGLEFGLGNLMPGPPFVPSVYLYVEIVPKTDGTFSLGYKKPVWVVA